MLWKNTAWAQTALDRVWASYHHPYWFIRSKLAPWTGSCDQIPLESFVVLPELPDGRQESSQLGQDEALVGEHLAITDNHEWNQWFSSAKFIRHLAGTKNADVRTREIKAVAVSLDLLTEN